jgi:hypothetical protein
MINPSAIVTPIIGFALLLCAVTIAIAILKKRSRKSAGLQPYRYKKVSNLLSPGERSFFDALETAVGDQVRIVPKVRLADILRVDEGTNRGAWQAAFNQIQSKHVDFLGCDPKDMTIKFVVELDDKSHRRQDRQERDDFVDRALATAGIPVFRFQARNSYSAEEIRKRIVSG